MWPSKQRLIFDKTILIILNASPYSQMWEPQGAERLSAMQPPLLAEKGTVKVLNCWKNLAFYNSHMNNCFNFFLHHFFVCFSPLCRNCPKLCWACCTQGEQFCEFYTHSVGIQDIFFFLPKTCRFTLLLLSCVGTRGSSQSSQLSTLLWGGRHGGGRSSGRLCSCCGTRWSAVLSFFFCPKGFYIPGSYRIVVLQVRASHSSLGRRLPHTKVCLVYSLESFNFFTVLEIFVFGAFENFEFFHYLNATFSLFLSSPTFIIPEVPAFNVEQPSEPSPRKSPRRSPPHTSPTIAAPTPCSPLESKHDVPYFRWHTYLTFLVSISQICQLFCG